MTSCLADLFREERLSDETAYYCEVCAIKVTAARRTVILKDPQHLVVTLNRFKFDAATMRQHKILTPVHVNQDISLSVTASGGSGVMGERLYQLYAVVMHSGSTPEFGHYYTVCKSSSDDSGNAGGDWLLCNDASVTALTAAAAQREMDGVGIATPYMLFYRAEASPAPKIVGETVASSSGDDVIVVSDAEPRSDAASSKRQCVEDAAGHQEAFTVDPAVLAAVQAENSLYLKAIESGASTDDPALAAASRSHDSSGGGSGGGGSRRFGGGFGRKGFGGGFGRGGLSFIY